MNLNKCRFGSIMNGGHFAATLSRQAGFTLVELLFVLVLMGILTMLALPFYASIKDRAKTAAATVEIRDLEKGVTAYSIDNGARLPSTLADIGRGGVRDPWGQLYQYQNIVNDHSAPRWGLYEPLNTDFDLYSYGADGVTALDDITATASLDDIIRSGDGSVVGLGRDFK